VKTHMDAILFENAISDAEFSPESMACLPDVCLKIPQEEFEVKKDEKCFDCYHRPSYCI
jgi:DIS3-like exonuclease 2